MTQKEFINIGLLVIIVALVGMGISALFGSEAQKPSLAPRIDRIIPSEAAIGDSVSITGSHFTSSNSLHFGDGFAYINGLSSSDGKTITFTVPEIFHACAPSGDPCAELLSQPIPGQTYQVSVITAHGTSNRVAFTVTGEPPIEPQPAPQPGSLSCIKDADCPSSQYACEVLQGTGTVCPDSDPSCVETFTVEKGICKLTEGNKCFRESDCAAGLLCHENICTDPIGEQCSGSDDATCPTDFECVQGCGSPVSYQDEPPPPYFCQLKGYMRVCPICLAGSTLIDTPTGQVPVKDIKEGMAVWTADTAGNRIQAVVLETSKTPVPKTHQMIHLVLSDARELFVSPGHPTADGKTVRELVSGEPYDEATIFAVNRVPYGEEATYDILPSGGTGFYWANGILLGSTLSH